MLCFLMVSVVCEKVGFREEFNLYLYIRKTILVEVWLKFVNKLESKNDINL